MKKALVPVLLATVALALSGCSSQLSTAETCLQFKGLLKVYGAPDNGSGTAVQKLAGIKAYSAQLEDLAGKASDDLKADLAKVAEASKAAADDDTAKMDAIAKDPSYEAAAVHIQSVCKISN